MARIEPGIVEGCGPGRTLGVRAEKVEIAEEGNGRLSCIVSEAEFLGNETLIGLEHKGVRGLTVMKPGLSMVPVGERMEVTFKNQDLHVFDEAGRRVSEHVSVT